MDYGELLNKFNSRLDELEKFPQKDYAKSITNVMEEKGVSRRDFMKWASMITGMLMLPSSFIPTVVRAAQLADRLPIIWLHMAECTGCSESLLRSDAPSIDSLIFNHISLEYHETLMAAAGWQAEENLENAMKKYKGRYVLMVEGGVPTVHARYGGSCRSGPRRLCTNPQKNRHRRRHRIPPRHFHPTMDPAGKPANTKEIECKEDRYKRTDTGHTSKHRLQATVRGKQTGKGDSRSPTACPQPNLNPLPALLQFPELFLQLGDTALPLLRDKHLPALRATIGDASGQIVPTAHAERRYGGG